MDILNILLAIALGAMIAINVFFKARIKFYSTQLNEACDAVDLLCERITTQIFCDVITYVNFNAEEDSTVVDFSNYKKERVVGYYVNTTDDWPDEVKKIINERELDVNDFNLPTRHKNATVYQQKGEWVWDS